MRPRPRRRRPGTRRPPLSRLTLGLWMMLWTRKETGLPAFRMASTASSWLASLRSTPPTCQRSIRKSGTASPCFFPPPRPNTHLHDPVSGLQGPVLPGGAVLQDVLDEDAPHHLSVVQPAAHPAPPHDADAQRLPRLSEELHPEGRNRHVYTPTGENLNPSRPGAEAGLTSWVGSSCRGRRSPPLRHPPVRAGRERLCAGRRNKFGDSELQRWLRSNVRPTLEVEPPGRTRPPARALSRPCTPPDTLLEHT